MISKHKRNCEICGFKTNILIYKQKFILGNNNEFRYDVVTCKKCGFTFATNLPQPSKLEKFYKVNTKYVYQHNQGTIPEFAKKLHFESFKIIDNYLKKSFKFEKASLKILDIGCGNGYLLNVFKRNGYTNLLGIEPARESSLVAKKLYGIRVLPKTLTDYLPTEKFDLIIFSSVLEHLSELDKNISKAISILKDTGNVFISVPDGDNFGKILREPFLEFSLEHINYFTRNSLDNLLTSHGLKNIKFKSLPIKLYGGYALNSLWKKNFKEKLTAFKMSDNRNIKNYIKISVNKLKRINNKIKKLVKSREKIIIWGVGSLTSRLLATTDLKRTKIQLFIDSNVNMQGNKINNIQIAPPSVLKNQKTTIFISTYIYAKEIKEILRSKYNFKGKIISL